MFKKLVVVGGIAAVAGLGVGGVAIADSNSTAPAVVALAPGNLSGDVAVPAAVTTTTSQPGDAVKQAKSDRAGTRHGLAKRLEAVAHAQWVSKDGKTGTFVTHDAIRGDVSAVSGTSITIKAADGTSESFTVNATTKVHVKGDKGAARTPGSISKVKVGDRAAVLATGAGTMTATQVVDRGVSGTHRSATGAPATSAPATS